MQPAEWAVVGWQYQHVVWNARLERGQGCQPVTQRISIRLSRVHGNIRGYPGQYLIARDEKQQVRAIKAGMLRRMALTDHDRPFVVSHLQRFAIGDSPIGG